MSLQQHMDSTTNPNLVTKSMAGSMTVQLPGSTSAVYTRKGETNGFYNFFCSFLTKS